MIRHFAQKRSRPRVALFVGALILGGLILGANAITLDGLRENTLRSVKANLTSQGIVLAEEADRSFKVLDLALSIVSDYIARLGVNDSEALQHKLAGPEIHRWLKEKMAGMAHVDAITVISAHGKLINFSRYWPIPNVDVTDRDYFQALKADATLETFISKPVQNRGTGTWTIYLARRLNTPDGEFMGLVLGAVTLQYFEGFFKSISLQEGSAVALLRQDGMLLARHPHSTEVGKILPAVAPTSRARTVTIVRNKSPLDGQVRIVSARPLANYPLRIAVSQTEESALRSWRSLARLSNAMAAASAFLVLLMALAVFLWWRKQESLTKELHHQNTRFDAALQHMAQGLAMFDSDRKLIVCNDRYAEIYGLPPDLVKPGTTQKQILEHRIASGAYGGPCPEQYISERTAFAANGTPSDTIVELSTGRTVAVAHRPIAGGGWVATHDDITERRRTEADRDRNRKLLDMVVENVPSTIVVKDAHDFRYMLINRSGEQYYGIPRNQMLGRTAHECLPKASADLVTKLDREVVATHPKSIVNEHTIEMPGHGTRIGMSTRTCFLGANGEPEYLLAVVDDVTERRASEIQITHMAHHDALTDLPNRVLLRERLEQALTGTRRGDRGLAVLVLDLDRFKEVNDTLGHPVGDALLKVVAERLRACAREGTTIARLGGDEFAIVEEVADAATEATVLAERFQTALSAPFDLGDHQVVVGSSIGIAVAPGDGTDAEQILKNVDLALYRAKSDGRGTFRFFEPEMDARMRERRALERDLRNALAKGEFELYYQPFVNLQRNEVCGFEALLRWHHPERGMVSPVEFIPVAEESGLIVPIGEWVIRTACAEAATWPEHIKVAVNLSPAQFKNTNLVQMVFSALTASGLSGRRLELEITESALLQNNAATLAAVHQLRALGIQISMDDFGTGYSSLGYLQDFPFDKIKIDRSFIANLSNGPGALAILKAITTLATSLGVTTIAEGVETQEQLDKVRAEGCGEMQGFLFSRARPAKEIARLFLPSPEMVENAA